MLECVHFHLTSAESNSKENHRVSSSCSVVMNTLQGKWEEEDVGIKLRKKERKKKQGSISRPRRKHSAYVCMYAEIFVISGMSCRLCACRGGDSHTKAVEIYFCLMKMHCNIAPLPGKWEHVGDRKADMPQNTQVLQQHSVLEVLKRKLLSQINPISMTQ